MTLERISQIFFFALEPDSSLAAEIEARKINLRIAGGHQQYLDDPPHLTVYLAAFLDGDGLIDALSKIAVGLSAPCVRTTGWDLFTSDPLTGSTTLVTAIDPVDKSRLRQLQANVIGHVAPMRNEASTTQRYAGVWEKLSANRRRAIERDGFPYVGEDWQPHFTIASVAPAVWAKVWKKIGHDPIVGSGRCDAFVLYKIEDEKPVEVARRHLPRPSSCE